MAGGRRRRLLFNPQWSAFIEYHYLDYTSTQINTNQSRDLGQHLVGAGVRLLFPLRASNLSDRLSESASFDQEADFFMVALLTQHCSIALKSYNASRQAQHDCAVKSIPTNRTKNTETGETYPTNGQFIFLGFRRWPR